MSDYTVRLNALRGLLWLPGPFVILAFVLAVMIKPVAPPVNTPYALPAIMFLIFLPGLFTTILAYAMKYTPRLLQIEYLGVLIVTLLGLYSWVQVWPLLVAILANL